MNRDRDSEESDEAPELDLTVVAEPQGLADASGLATTERVGDRKDLGPGQEGRGGE